MITEETGLTKAQGRGDGHEAGEHAVGHHAGVGLAELRHHDEHRAEGAARGGEHGVGGDHADAQVGAGQFKCYTFALSTLSHTEYDNAALHICMPHQ